jgi:Sec-independent protein translocase protein TatA
MLFGLGLWELIILAGLFVALFGLKQVSPAARQLGRIHATWQKLKHKFPFLLRLLGR